jgi:hypothetical protein
MAKFLIISLFRQFPKTLRNLPHSGLKQLYYRDALVLERYRTLAVSYLLVLTQMSTSRDRAVPRQERDRIRGNVIELLDGHP